MHNRKLIRIAIALLIPAISFAQQGKKDIYAEPENLKVLPKDISPHDLSATMKGFALGLGVRCETCHVGEKGKPLRTFDFASDKKAMKKKARVMWNMVQEINTRLVPKLDEIETAERVPVRCVTCHRGQRQPKLIEDVLDEQLAKGGKQAALEKYAELRKQYYGSHSYDFSEFTLPIYAQGLAKKGKIEPAIALVEINAAHFPDSFYTAFSLAEMYQNSGNKEQAITSYRKAQKLNPRAKAFIESKIAKLQAREGKPD